MRAAGAAALTVGGEKAVDPPLVRRAAGAPGRLVEGGHDPSVRAARRRGFRRRWPVNGVPAMARGPRTSVHGPLRM
jgi:hypothetical protein